jgi:two-component system, LuxR family, sensor kinase FixL
MHDGRSLHILVIEDDDDTRANLGDVLELDNHRVAMAATAAEALGRQDWSQLDAVILDRKLPDGTADDLLPRLKELAPEAAVIIVTGFSDVEGAITALRRGASDYILKPINPDALRASLKRLSEAKQAERELRTRAEQQAVVAEIGRRALQSVDISRLMDETVAQVARTLHVEFAKILEVLPDESGLLLRAGFGWRKGVIGKPVVNACGELHIGDHGQPDLPVIIEDLPNDPRFRFTHLLSEHGVVSGLSVAIHGEKRPFGTLGVYARQPRWFTKSDVDFLQAIAHMLAAAIERIKSEERMLQNERLAAIGQMVTGLAHESRNALQRSQACLEMLALELEDRPEALQLVGRIHRAQDHLHHLYEEVRGYAAPIHLRRQVCNVSTLWRDTWAHLDVVRQAKSVQLIEHVDDAADLQCSVDRYAIEQVLRNVLENAIAACPDPGEITVVAAEVDLADASGGRGLEIVIRDNGPGLSPEQQGRVFEPFFTTKTRGTGLGMAIAKRLMEAHGGRIDVRNAASGGAEVQLLLPRSQT